MKFIPVAQPEIGIEERNAILDCVDSSWISSTGKYIGQFEEQFGKLLNVKYAISCSNGTAALHLALLALGIGAGDEVILPALTFVSSANVIRYLGAKAVLVDIDEKTWNMDVGEIEKKITKKTKAIMPVHLYGYPVEMDRLMKLAKKHKLKVIEDAAEAHFAKFRGKHVGTWGDIGCFSFFGNKIVTTGEGGMLVTNNASLAKKIILLKNHGMSSKKRYFHPVIGYNYRMTNLQAAIGHGQLSKIATLLEKRQAINNEYRKRLAEIPGVILQPIQNHLESVCWLFSIVIDERFGKKRNQLIEYLREHGVDSRPFFYPLHFFPMYKMSKKSGFPKTEKISARGLNLPTFTQLTKQQIAYIAKIIDKSRND